MSITERTDEDGHPLPWEIQEITATHDGWLRFRGTNHYAKPGEYGHTFSWQLDALSFKDPEFDARRYDLRGATITAEARTLLRRLVLAWTRRQCEAVAGLWDLMWLDIETTPIPEFFAGHGFAEELTGGNCSAYVCMRDDGTEVWITATTGPETPSSLDETIWICVYRTGHVDEGPIALPSGSVMSYEHFTVRDYFEMLNVRH